MAQDEGSPSFRSAVFAVRRKVSIYTQAIQGKMSIEDAIRKAGIQEKYGLSEGQLFNESSWKDRKKG